MIVEDGTRITGATSYVTTDYADALLANSSTWAGSKSQGSLTLNSNPSNGDSFTVGSKTYTFQSTLTDLDGNIQIGSNLFETLDNLSSALQLLSPSGTKYAASMTALPDVSVLEGGAGLVLTADTSGIRGNMIPLTSSFSDGLNQFDSDTMGGTTEGTEGLTQAQKESYCESASQYIDQTYGDRVDGCKATDSQGLVFPVTGLVVNNFLVSEYSVPVGVSRATVLIAEELSNGRVLNPVIEGESNNDKDFKKLGPLVILKEWSNSKSSAPSFPAVDKWMGPYITVGSRVMRG